MIAAELICQALSNLGISHAFAMPGTQLIPLYAALRHSRIRTVLASHELSATFMANGYYRASGRPALLITIPGPGLTYTVTGLAEAKHDSAALIYLLVRKRNIPGGPFGFQLIDQVSITSSLVKKYFIVEKPEQIALILQDAVQLATSGQPGPVIVEIDVDLLSQSVADAQPGVSSTRERMGEPAQNHTKAVIDRLRASRRPVLLFGQGAQEAPQSARAVAEALRCPVVTTISGRGVLPESHSCLVAPDFGLYGVEVVNALILASDLVLAIGCKFTHNGTGGFRLKLPQEKLIHVDADPDVPGANHPTSLSICADAPSFINSIAKELVGPAVGSGWSDDDLSMWKKKFLEELRKTHPYFPRAVECDPPEIASFFAALSRALPVESTIVTDSGLHQYLTRIYAQIQVPRGLVTPSDFQSMGFGLPAAIGAKLARPERDTVLITGDGGFAMTGMELLTVMREKIPITVIVFNDGALGLIREQQVDMMGDTFGVDLYNPDFEMFASAIGLDYYRAEGQCEVQLRSAIQNPRGALVEVCLRQTGARRRQLAKSKARGSMKRAIRALLPALLLRKLKR